MLELNKTETKELFEFVKKYRSIRKDTLGFIYNRRYFTLAVNSLDETSFFAYTDPIQFKNDKLLDMINNTVFIGNNIYATLKETKTCNLDIAGNGTGVIIYPEEKINMTALKLFDRYDENCETLLQYIDKYSEIIYDNTTEGYDITHLVKDMYINKGCYVLEIDGYKIHTSYKTFKGYKFTKNIQPIVHASVYDIGNDSAVLKIKIDSLNVLYRFVKY